MFCDIMSVDKGEEENKMLIDIPDCEKVYIGKVIEIARKEKGLTIENLIEGICAKQTYYKIRKEIISESEVYDSLLERVELFYDYQGEHILSYEGLWNAFVEQNWDKFSNEIKKYNIESKKMDVSESVINTAIKLMGENFDYNLAKELLPVLPEALKEIVSYFVLKHLYDNGTDKSMDLSFIALGTLVNKVEYLYLLIKWEFFYKATILCNMLLERTQGKIHYSVLMAKLFIVQTIEPSSYEDCCNEIKNDPCFIPNSNYVYDFMYTAGMFYYVRQEYEKAWVYLSKVCQETKYKIPGLLFLYHMETITDNRLSEHFFYDMIDSEMEKPYEILFNYYYQKYNNIKLDILEDYLWKDCNVIIENSYPQDVVKKIIKDELYWIASHNGDKRRYYQFTKKFRN